MFCRTENARQLERRCGILRISQNRSTSFDRKPASFARDVRFARIVGDRHGSLCRSLPNRAPGKRYLALSNGKTCAAAPVGVRGQLRGLVRARGSRVRRSHLDVNSAESIL